MRGSVRPGGVGLLIGVALAIGLAAPAAFGAEATIDSTVGTSYVQNDNYPSVVFISDQTGYVFYRDLSPDDCVYAKTTNGGATWVGGGSIMTASCRGIAVWYDRWTPGDTTGTYIHLAMLDGTGDDAIYDRLDTSNDTLLGNALLFDLTETGNPISGLDQVAITKATDGVLYLGLSEGGGGTGAKASGVKKCSATCGTAGNWTSAGTNPLDQSDDPIRLLPLASGNVLLIRDDISVDDIQSKVYTSGTNAWDGAWTTIDANAPESTTYDTTLAATVKRSDNTIYLAYGADVGGASTADIRTAVYSGGSWTAKTNVLTNANTMIGLDIALDTNTGDLYVVYLRGTIATAMNAYSKKSTDGMTSWGVETQFNTSNTDLQIVLTNFMSDERIYGVYWQNTATNDGLFGDTIADLIPNTAPNAPTSLSPAAGAATNDNTPTLSFTQSDPQGADTVKFQVQVDDTSNFSSLLVDYTSALIAQGATSFTVGQAAGSGTYNGGVGSAGQTLADGNYYWRVKSTDNGSLFSAWATANGGEIAFKVDTVVPTCATRETADLDSDGYLDALYLTCSEAILDSSIHVSDFTTASPDVGAFAFSSTTNSDTADDADFYLTFTDGTHHGGITPTLTYTQDSPTDNDVTDLAGNKLANLSLAATTDAAKPVLLGAKSNRASGETILNAVGERLDLRFSEPMNATLPTEAQLEAGLTFAGGATDSDNLPSIGTGTDPFALAGTVVSNDTIRVTFNTNNTANANLLTVGTHTVQVTTGTNIKDVANNAANTTPAALTIAVGEILTGGSVTYSDGVDAGSGDVGWDQVSWNDTETTGSILYQVEYYTGAAWALVPDADLAGNSAGFGTSPIDISGLLPGTYSQLRLKATFTYADGGTPILNDWTISWKRRPTSSGSAGDPLIY